MIRNYEAEVLDDDNLLIGEFEVFGIEQIDAEHQAYELAAEEIPNFTRKFKAGACTLWIYQNDPKKAIQIVH